MIIDPTVIFEQIDRDEKYLSECQNNVIFLDIDGVLNTETSRCYGELLVAEFVSRVSNLAYNTNMSIVISSTWRKREGIIDKIKFAFTCTGFRASFNRNQLQYDKVSIYTGSKNRVDYISKYVETYKPIKYLILDDVDYCWSRKNLDSRFLHVDSTIGFTEYDYNKALEILSR